MDQDYSDTNDSFWTPHRPHGAEWRRSLTCVTPTVMVKSSKQYTCSLPVSRLVSEEPAHNVSTLVDSVNYVRQLCISRAVSELKIFTFT